jgi:hypothetical protein
MMIQSMHHSGQWWYDYPHSDFLLANNQINLYNSISICYSCYRYMQCCKIGNNLWWNVELFVIEN